MASSMKIYPTVEECQVKNKVSCPVKDCGQTFTSESNLNMHLSKTHRTMDLKSTSALEKWYFCPDSKCPWNGSKHFVNMKSLRQHFLKVHMAKLFSCGTCQKGFQNRLLLDRHVKYCDVSFNCLDCKNSYGCYETLKTHCRRKKHRLLNKKDYKAVVITQSKSEIFLGNPSERLILPKKSCSEEILSESNKPIQLSQHTQTGSKNNVFSVETQTVKNVKCNNSEDSNNYKNTNTQTDLIESKETSCNTSFNTEDFEFALKNDVETNCSSTQTHWPSEDIFTISTATHGSTHTDTSDLLSDSLSNFDTNFFNCNSETQTDLMFENEIFNSDYYSNMYTQTCDEILSGLNGFTDIQTQTALHDTLRSVESQTLMSSADKLCPNILKDIVHSETQTDAEFRQMLEIINS